MTRGPQELASKPSVNWRLLLVAFVCALSYAFPASAQSPPCGTYHYPFGATNEYVYLDSNLPVPYLDDRYDLLPSITTIPNAQPFQVSIMKSFSGADSPDTLISVSPAGIPGPNPTVTVGGRSGVCTSITVDVTHVPPGTYLETASYSGYQPDYPCDSDTPCPGYAINYSIPIIIGVYPSAAFVLLDPVPTLISNNLIAGVPQLQTTAARVVSGVAADGVSQAVIRVQGPNIAGHTFTLQLFNDQGVQSTSSVQDGALGLPGTSVLSMSQNQITVTAGSADGNGNAYAFGVYRAPVDFARPSGTGFLSGTCNGTTASDDSLQCRAVSLKVIDTTGGENVFVTQGPMIIVRPPVVLVHGVWDSGSVWNNFSPLLSGPLGSGTTDRRFSIYEANYNDTIGPYLASTDPAVGNPQKVQSNSLGFGWNAGGVLIQTISDLQDFKTGSNAAAAPVAAVQADFVGHSMGGLVARTMVLQTRFLNDGKTFGQGYIHKLITIDSPHKGTLLATHMLSTQENGNCLQNLLADYGEFVFKSVTFGPSRGNVTWSGAAADMVDQPLSSALTALSNSSIHPVPTTMIEGAYTNWSALQGGNAAIIRGWPGVGCPSDPLAQSLTPAGWQALFNNEDNDGIVPSASQTNGLEFPADELFTGYVHSIGSEKLGFSGPSVLDAGAVPTEVINLLNIPITNSLYYVPSNP